MIARSLARRSVLLSLLSSIGLTSLACSAAAPPEVDDEAAVQSSSEALTSPCGLTPKAPVCNKMVCTGGDGWVAMALPKGSSCTASTGVAGFCDGGGGSGENGRCFAPITGELEPRYYVLSVIYAPPGLQSTVDYTQGESFDTTTSTVKTFTAAESVTVSNTASFLGLAAGNLSVTGTHSNADSTNNSTDVKSTTLTDIIVSGFGDQVNHDFDRIYLWLNPQVNVSSIFGKLSWALALRDGEHADVTYVTPGMLKGTTAMPLGTLVELESAGIVAADYPAILSVDPFANGATTIDGSRFVYQRQIDYTADSASGQTGEPTKVSVTDSSSITNGIGSSSIYSVAVTAKGSVDFLGLINAGVTATGTLTWKSDNNNATTNASSMAAAVSLAQPPLGYTGPASVNVYRDTVYNSFLFELPSCNPAYLYEGDFDGDGRSDLLCTSTLVPGQVWSFLSKGDGTFDPRSAMTSVDIADQNGKNLLLADVNGDGKTDLVHLATTGGKVMTWISNGDGTFNPVTFTTTADTCLYGCGSWQIGDTNHDGKMDLIHVTNLAGSVVTWLSNGNGTYNPTWYTTKSDTQLQNGEGMLAADVNGDGQTDLVHITTNPGAVATWLSTANGTYSVVWYTDTTDTCLINCGTWQFGDVNGDGRTDLIHLTTNPGAIVTWLSNGDGTYKQVWNTSTTDVQLQNGKSLFVADVNGDGKTDLVHVTTNSGNVITWLSNGDGSYATTSFVSTTDTCLSDCGTWRFGDLDHDGKTDLLHLYEAKATSWISKGNGTFGVTPFMLPLP